MFTGCPAFAGHDESEFKIKGNTMEMRAFGRTGMNFSILGFGCGAVGGLMVRGDPADQERTVARALEAGVNYFDTAVQYGNGASEQNLGRVLKALKVTNAYVGTKVRLQPEEFSGIGAAVTARSKRACGGSGSSASIFFICTIRSRMAPPPRSRSGRCSTRSCQPSSACDARASCGS